MLLLTGQLLSRVGTSVGVIAFPLLVLAVTHSPAKAGVVAFLRTLPFALFTLPAGAAADHWNRKRLMIGADLARLVALGGLAAALLLHHSPLWAIGLVAFVEGSAGVVFFAAVSGAFRAVVPRSQLPAATAVQTGRDAAVSLAGPPLGGALFGLARSLPFVADAVSYAFSTLSLLLMRTPFQEEREPDPAPLRSRIAEGFRFLWSRPFLRTTAFLFSLGNFIGPGLLFAIVVIGKQQGLSGGEVGALVGVFAAGIFVGSFLSPLVRRALPTRAVLVLEFWTWPGCALFLIWPNVYVLVAGMIPTALVIPSTDSVVHSTRIAMTPDRLLGRAEAAWSAVSLPIWPLGQLLTGVLLGAAPARVTIAVYAASALLLAVLGTLSPALRDAPSIDELAESSLD
jgi:Major Facilitator Superfamily